MNPQRAFCPNMDCPAKLALGGSSAPNAAAKPRLKTRYRGMVSLNAERADQEMATIVEEIVQRLISLAGTDVQITVEISATRGQGFDNATEMTVSENSRTLKFKHYSFEE